VTSAVNPLVEAAVEETLVYSSEKLLIKQYRSISVMIIILKKINFLAHIDFFFKTDFSVMSIDLYCYLNSISNPGHVDFRTILETYF